MKYLGKREYSQSTNYRFNLPIGIVVIKFAIFQTVMILNPNRRGIGKLIYKENLSKDEIEFVESKLKKVG